VKHRREQEKVIAANETNLHRAFSRQQFLKMNGGIDPTETTAENDDSLFVLLIGYAIDHRVLSVAKLPVIARLTRTTSTIVRLSRELPRKW
jgi:hypothetical protein